MALKFNEALEMLIENLSNNPTPEHKSYVQDASDISEKICQEFTNIDSIFKGTISNLDKTYMFFNISFPKMVEPLLWLKMPFKVEPQRLHIPQYKVFHLKTSVAHPAVVNNFVKGDKLAKLFFTDLSKVIGRVSQIECKSGKSYSIEHGMDMGKNFIINAYEAGQVVEAISYTFSLQFSFFDHSILYATNNNLFFQETESDRPKKLATIHMIVHTLLIQLKVYLSLSIKVGAYLFDSINWKLVTNAGDTLLEVLMKVISIMPNPEPMKSVYLKLLQLKQLDSVEMPELKALFGLH
ncbi:uncharacterized protein LOC128258180 [Drosophila gunungcola]|uniref:Uncharacterized protein n=1 Tax=Drosophila gunungcola TaxID=103775 RepID=A0A9P9YNM0_9MUSC|nr:uncharacterized protein LOC128258180 [Drosophila gunungcola]KAI8040241.1 hypothetical protein M5D96_006181 [Drosophila gunungcola]